MSYMYLHPSQDNSSNILISSQRKVSYYTMEGEFIKEIRARSNAGYTYTPLGDKFIANAYDMKKKIYYITINMHDSQLNKIKEVHREKSFIQTGRKINPLMYGFPWFLTYKGQIFITVDSLNGIAVFDQKGKGRYKIKPDFEKIKVTDKDKRGLHDFFKNHALWRMQYESKKHLLKFPKYFPGICNTDIADNKIYVTGYGNQQGKTTIIVLDLHCKMIKKINGITLARKNPLSTYPFTIKNDVLYQLVKSKRTKTWTLQIHPLR